MSGMVSPMVSGPSHSTCSPAQPMICPSTQLALSLYFPPRVHSVHTLPFP